MLVLLAAGLLLSDATYTVEETIATCALIEDDGDRLACFDQLAVVVAGVDGPGPAVAAAPTDRAPMTAPTSAPTPPAASPAAPAPTARAAAPQPDAAEAPQRFVIMRADDPKLKAMEENKGFLSGFFRRETYDAVVVAWKRNNMGALFMELDNGEIWRESRPRLRHDPAKGEAVRLQPAATGGWYAIFPDVDRRVKMRRVDIDD